jgi:hypothetical protein
MLKTIEKIVFNFKRGWEAGVRMRNGLGIVMADPVLSKIVGRNVFVSDDHCLLAGILPEIPAPFVDRLGQIWVPAIFRSQPEWYQKAILLHEVGHIKLGHMNVPASALVANQLKRNLGFASALKIELEADGFAKGAGGDIYAALGHVRGVMLKHGISANSVPVRELDLRMQILAKG